MYVFKRLWGRLAGEYKGVAPQVFRRRGAGPHRPHGVGADERKTERKRNIITARRSQLTLGGRVSEFATMRRYSLDGGRRAAFIGSDRRRPSWCTCCT